jgi:hypothetical protein
MYSQTTPKMLWSLRGIFVLARKKAEQYLRIASIFGAVRAEKDRKGFIFLGWFDYITLL